jgi:hypothetical protein
MVNVPLMKSWRFIQDEGVMKVGKKPKAPGVPGMQSPIQVLNGPDVAYFLPVEVQKNYQRH